MALGCRGMTNYPRRAQARGVNPCFCKALMFYGHGNLYHLCRYMVRLLQMSVKYLRTSPGNTEPAIMAADLCFFDFNNVEISFVDI